MASLTPTDMDWSELWETVKDREGCCAAGHGVMTERLSNTVPESGD